MEIFGFEFNKARTASSKESKSIKSTTEIGDSGTAIFEGIINEDHNSKLTGVDGIAIYFNIQFFID